MIDGASFSRPDKKFRRMFSMTPNAIKRRELKVRTKLNLVSRITERQICFELGEVVARQLIGGSVSGCFDFNPTLRLDERLFGEPCVERFRD